VYTCRELIEVKLAIHDSGINYTPFGADIQLLVEKKNSIGR